ncbi:glycoside hydrolase [Babesia caballi]|uniref:Glycoside hydrolase n=1 Tax=Babesia caballi TaxID=5871 RepID=A0AAV4LXI1_BABCB|nr:glycoside hydrolase [Babesia caballi]
MPTVIQLLNPTKPIEKADDKVQHGVANLILCHVRGKNAGAGNFGGTSITKLSTIIPNELLKSIGQLGNETGTTRSQSLNNLINIHTSPGCRVSNVTEKFRNFAGEGLDRLLTLTTRILPILPRHPQDSVDGLLQVGRGVQKRGRSFLSLVKLTGFTEAYIRQEGFEGLLILSSGATAAVDFMLSPARVTTAIRSAPPVQVTQPEVEHGHDAQEYEGAVSVLVSSKGVPRFADGIVRGLVVRTANASVLSDKLLQSVGKLGDGTAGWSTPGDVAKVGFEHKGFSGVLLRRRLKPTSSLAEYATNFTG